MVDQEDEQDQEQNQSSEQILEFEPTAGKPRQVLVTDEELKALQKELIEYKDKYLRLLADAENARKRLQKERQEMTRYAIENVIVDFLHPLDNLENALKFAQNMSEEVKNWAFGFQMILTQFKDVLSNNAVLSIESLGTPFDPHIHEAVEMIETDKQPPGTVVEECVRGYKIGERIIRPARVKVAKIGATIEESRQEEED